MPSASTPNVVGCLSWAWCSGRPSRGTVGWLSPAPAGADPVRAECGLGGPLPILDTLLGIGRSEHSLARYAVHPGETVKSSRVLQELHMVGLLAPKPGRRTFTFTFPEHGRKRRLFEYGQVLGEVRSFGCHASVVATCRAVWGVPSFFTSLVKKIVFLPRAAELRERRLVRERGHHQELESDLEHKFVVYRSNDSEGPNTLPPISTRPDRRFIEELNGVAQAQPAPVVDLTADVGNVPERVASQASTSGREDSLGSESSSPSREPIQARQRPQGRTMRINDQRVYRRANMEMVDLVGGLPVYTVDYFTSAVTPRYLSALREEFRIPGEVDLVVPGERDLPSRPPPGYIALLAEYF
ncbi:hypothetical protein TIFTF001_047251 [Ficus carica]|uniref:Uncharacterized protein n=1 Tax=Ficus carica TaxID=3494 RepID=A0AA87ZAW6_FICCA|nr:hypothetical protein TIFTF001_047238 [Ficus carica]GMN21228.1 hypothetical protein TIFTF001_047242 [Ficus carica]GMN21255.1 hypothetical protein TIFTF001_047247 [Ficus carica]GMN21261.1 hypothetical protein TIFTF001_047251 [Ficus carica]